MIEIFRNHHEFQYYEKDKPRKNNCCSIKCEYCNRIYLDINYIKIIEKLKESGLLDKNYPLQCCDCYDNSLWMTFKQYKQSLRS